MARPVLEYRRHAKFYYHTRVMRCCISALATNIHVMHKYLTAVLFTAAVGGMVVLTAPGAKAASAISVAETAIIDVVEDMSQIQQVRGSNRYKEQIRRHLRIGRGGDADALRQLGFFYAKGWGVIRDLTKAYMWFTLAGMQGSQDALENRDTVAGRLSAEQISRAEAMAERWRATYQWEIEAGSFGD